jgi:hypothetical protein
MPAVDDDGAADVKRCGIVQQSENRLNGVGHAVIGPGTIDV